MRVKPLRPPPGTGTIEHLREVTRSASVAKVVAVQTGTAYQWDNSLLADTVKANRNWMAGVCSLNPQDPDSRSELIRLVEEYGVRGLRIAATADSPRAKGYLGDGILELWRMAERLDIIICTHTRAEYLESLAHYLRRFPRVPVVLDHCAYLSASEHPEYPTLIKLLALRKFQNLHAKLSFVVGGSKEEYPCPDTHALALRVIEEFGAERCMWGSCFPTELWIPKVTYAQHLQIFTREMGLGDGIKRLLLEEAPMNLWFP